ncbi:hypothetical protein SUGI_0013830 [Cryptomeria japonica]|nr:hypothetical protein SUGI_0013830 [Cryptomeria japonica]
MRGIHFQMSHSQQKRLARAQQQLLQSAAKIPSSVCVNVGDAIPVNHEDGILKGHGTIDVNGQVVATLCGVVERVNKLVLVRTLRARYKPEVGDIIVGRVIEVVPKRWKVDIGFNQDAVLMLSAMTLPDGIQRRRTTVDELNMRSVFEENDVICAEVRGLQHDGSLHLQARSDKYGKLENGQLITTSAYLVKRRKQHFHFLEQYGVDMILGCNGYIWVGAHTDLQSTSRQGEEPDVSGQKESQSTISEALNSVDAVAEFYVRIAEREAERRSSKSNV